MSYKTFRYSIQLNGILFRTFTIAVAEITRNIHRAKFSFAWLGMTSHYPRKFKPRATLQIAKSATHNASHCE